MDGRLGMAREAIRAFLRAHYSDAQLAALLDHARAGRLSYHSCCCLVGIPTADHALQGFNSGQQNMYGHLRDAQNTFDDAGPADGAFCTLGYDHSDGDDPDEVRRRRIIPIILGEIRRRSTINARGVTYDAESVNV